MIEILKREDHDVGLPLAIHTGKEFP